MVGPGGQGGRPVIHIEDDPVILILMTPDHPTDVVIHDGDPWVSQPAAGQGQTPVLIPADDLRHEFHHCHPRLLTESLQHSPEGIAKAQTPDEHMHILRAEFIADDAAQFLLREMLPGGHELLAINADRIVTVVAMQGYLIAVGGGGLIDQNGFYQDTLVCESARAGQGGKGNPIRFLRICQTQSLNL